MAENVGLQEGDIVNLGDEDQETDLMSQLGLPVGFGGSRPTSASFDSVAKRLKGEDSLQTPTSSNGSTEVKFGKDRTKHRQQNTVFESENEEEFEKSSDDEAYVAESPVSSTWYPAEFVVDIEAHETRRTVAAMSLNPKGARMVTGSLDGEICMWDFNGMTTEFRYFRKFVPLESHGVQSLAYNTTGSQYLCCAGDSSCRIYDGDGKHLQSTVLGDIYVRDMANTKGHTHMVMDCQWHPFDREKFLTASMDATVRIWDVNAKPYGIDQYLPHLHCLKAIDKRRLNISSCHAVCASWAPKQAKYIVAGCGDGSLQMWNEKKCYSKPDKVVRPAHADGTAVSGVRILTDNIRILSRGEDDTVRLWDVRKFKDPVFSWTGLPSVSGKANITTNPAETVVVATTAADDSGSGRVVIYSLDDLSQSPVGSLRVEGYSPIRVEWPEETNQIVTSCSKGQVKVFVDSKKSSKGALLISRSTGKKKDDFKGFMEPVFTPSSLPSTYKETRQGTIRKVKPKITETDLNQKTRVPPRPTGKEGSQGRQSTAVSMSQYLLGAMNLKGRITNEDSADVLRNYADITAKSDTSFLPSIYKVTQPKQIHASPGGADNPLDQVSAKCPRCGLKLCQCGYMASDLYGARKQMGAASAETPPPKRKRP
eukprot:Lankesteria_metandrocarpae@DN539_c0_g1_i1.p1